MFCVSYDCLRIRLFDDAAVLGHNTNSNHGLLRYGRTYEMWMVEPMIVGLICGFCDCVLVDDLVDVLWSSTWSHEWLLIGRTC